MGGVSPVWHPGKVLTAPSWRRSLGSWHAVPSRQAFTCASLPLEVSDTCARSQPQTGQQTAAAAGALRSRYFDVGAPALRISDVAAAAADTECDCTGGWGS